MSMIRTCDICGKTINNTEGYYNIPKEFIDDCLFDIDICANCMEEISRKVKKGAVGEDDAK